MTMKFRTVKAAVVSLLGAAAAGQYRVAGYQDQGLSSDEISGSNRLVQVFCESGDFPKNASGYGPFTHDVSLKINLIVSEDAACDLTVLNDPSATAVQLAAALAALEPASERADDSLDELFDLVFQELMKGDNVNFGISSFQIANRWVEGFRKGQVSGRGEYAVLSGEITLGFRVEEEVVTVTKADLEFIDNTLTIQDDVDDPKAGTYEEF